MYGWCILLVLLMFIFESYSQWVCISRTCGQSFLVLTKIQLQVPLHPIRIGKIYMTHLQAAEKYRCGFHPHSFHMFTPKTTLQNLHMYETRVQVVYFHSALYQVGEVDLYKDAHMIYNLIYIAIYLPFGRHANKGSCDCQWRQNLTFCQIFFN